MDGALAGRSPAPAGAAGALIGPPAPPVARRHKPPGRRCGGPEIAIGSGRPQQRRNPTGAGGVPQGSACLRGGRGSDLANALEPGPQVEEQAAFGAGGVEEGLTAGLVPAGGGDGGEIGELGGVGGGGQGEGGGGGGEGGPHPGGGGQGLGPPGGAPPRGAGPLGPGGGAVAQCGG